MNLLTHTSKMPCASFSLPAWESCPAARQVSGGPGSICSMCYARKGRYRFPNVAGAQRRRRAYVLRSLRENGGRSFVSRMVEQIRKTGVGLFRIHDSGDLFSADYARCWSRIAEALPGVRFRCPTREWAAPGSDRWPAVLELASLPNVNVQPSALNLEDPPPEMPGLGAGTAVSASPEGHAFVCPATTPGKPKSCHENECYACWDRSSRRGITYIKH